MADDALVLEVREQGSAEVVAALTRVQQAEQSVTQAAERARATTRENMGWMQKMQQARQRDAASSNLQARAQAHLNRALPTTTNNIKQVTTALRGTERMSMRAFMSNRRLGTSMGMVANETSEFVYALGTAIPGLRSTGMLMSQAGNSAMGMGMRMGPLGVALGVLTGAIPALISGLSSTSTEMDNTGNSARAATRDIMQMVQAMAQARRVEAVEAAVRAGTGTAAQQEAYVEVLRRGRGEGGAGGETGGLEAAREALTSSIVDAMGDSTFTQRFVEGIGRDIDLATRRGGDVSRLTALSARLRGVPALGGRGGQVEAPQVFRHLGEVTRLQREITGALGAMHERRASEAQTTRAVTRMENLTERRAEQAAAARSGRRGGGGGGGGGAARGDREAARVARENARQLREFATSMGPSLDVLMARESMLVAQQMQQNAANKAEAAKRMADRAAAQDTRRLAARQRAAMRAANQHSREIASAAEAWAGSWREGVDSVITSFDRFNEALTDAGINTLDESLAMRAVVRASWNDILQTTAGGARDAMASALEATLAGEQGFGDAIKAQTKAWIQGIVARSTVAAIEQGAMAIADLAIGNYKGAAMHGVAAAQYAAVAGVAAVVGYGTGTIGKAAKDPEKEKAKKEDKAGKERREAQTIVINVGTFPISTDADVGRAIESALAATGRREGRR